MISIMHPEILDIVPMKSESIATYTDLFDGLKERDMEKVDLIISDGHKGIKKAASESYNAPHFLDQ